VSYLKAEQHDEEFSRFLQIMRDEEIESYLEIGSKNGGTLWRVANEVPTIKRITAVDLPHGDGKTFVLLRECVMVVRDKGVTVNLIKGDSTDQTVIEQVGSYAPFDLCFIDANHTLKYCTQDWLNYGPMARIVAFHDIGWKEMHRKGKLPIEVPLLWDSVKRMPGARTEEISLCPRDNGIGIVWR
jgi:predicted O-methyltransferase YrrM